MTAQAQLALFKTKPDPVGLLDMRHAARVLAREDAELRAGPRAQACACARPWREDDGCLKCGRQIGRPKSHENGDPSGPLKRSRPTAESTTVTQQHKSGRAVREHPRPWPTTTGPP
jgi:hypothetical protein